MQRFWLGKFGFWDLGHPYQDDGLQVQEKLYLLKTVLGQKMANLVKRYKVSLRRIEMKILQVIECIAVMGPIKSLSQKEYGS